MGALLLSRVALGEPYHRALGQRGAALGICISPPVLPDATADRVDHGRELAEAQEALNFLQQAISSCGDLFLIVPFLFHADRQWLSVTRLTGRRPIRTYT